MTEQEKMDKVRELQAQNNGVLGFLVRAKNDPEGTAKYMPHLIPLLNDRIVAEMIVRYEEIASLRGW